MKSFIKKYKFDIILIFVLLLSTLALCLITVGTRERGSFVTVDEDGKRIGVFSLNEDGRYSFSDGGNILVIQGGEAYMEYADCPDGRCKRMGKIYMSGQRIICLPHRLTVTVIGGDGVDLESE